MSPCMVAGCPMVGALLHHDKAYCVPHYRAHPGTPLHPLPGATTSTDPSNRKK